MGKACPWISDTMPGVPALDLASVIDPPALPSVLMGEPGLLGGIRPGSKQTRNRLIGTPTFSHPPRRTPDQSSVGITAERPAVLLLFGVPA
jgi:hypothetical protein